MVPIKPVDFGDLGVGEERIVSVLHYGKASPDHYPIAAGWIYNPILGHPRTESPPSILRRFAGSPWTASAINTIIDEVTSLKYEIVTKAGYEETFDKNKKEEVEAFFKYPNRNGEGLLEIIKKLLKDILEIDGGVIVKVFSEGSFESEKKIKMKVNEDYTDEEGKILKTKTIRFANFKKSIIEKAEGTQTDNVHLNEIYARDAGSFLINTDIFGILPEDSPAYFQYSYLYPRGAPLGFHKREIVYFKMNPRTNSPYGWSKIQSLFTILEALNNSARFNRDAFIESAIPAGTLSLMNANKDSLDRFRQEWDKNIRGKPHKMAIFNQEVKWTPMHMTSKDMEWLNGQQFYQKLVWALFGVPSDELGFTDTSNRSVGQSQSRVFIRRAIMPHLQLLETKFTNEIIAEFYDGEPEVEFKFDFIDQHEGLLHKEEQWKDIELGVRTINEVRAERGLEPVEWGDEPYKKPGANFADFFGFGKPKGKEETENEAVNANKPEKSFIGFEEFKKKANTEILKKKISETDDYGKFLVSYYENIRKKTIKILHEEIKTKSIDSFAKRMAELFGIEELRKQIKKFIKRHFLEGIGIAENQLNIDIGFGDKDNIMVNELVKQQVDGYKITEQESFPGIKGVNKEEENKIIDVIKEGVKKGKPINEIAELVNERFDVTKSRAIMIARTETRRIQESGTYTGYVNSKMEGEVKWLATIDKKTSDACRYLNGRKVELGKKFLFPGSKNMKAWKGYYPPSHPNCRCTTIFVSKKR